MNANGASNTGWTRFRKWLYRAMGLLMLVQILFGLVWAVKNFNAIPGFGDTTEYIALSQNFALDEYRPILYPLLIRVARKVSEAHFHNILYLLQTGLSLFAMCHAVYTLDLTLHGRPAVSWTRQHKLLWLFGGLYLTSIPMINYMNLTLLTDSIANSLLVLMLSIAVQVIYASRLSVKQGVILAACLVGQCLIRADRLYSGILVLVILGLIALHRNPRVRRGILLGTVCVAVFTVALVGGVNSATQVRGRNGRVQTDFNFILLDRVVFPHMAETYEYFPQEIRDNITLEEAQVFDSHNNNVMYQLAPMLESRVGKEKAGEYYRTMAKIVWERSSDAVLREIGESMAVVVLFPIVSYLTLHHLYYKTNIGWNIHCLSIATPELTALYSKVGFLILAATILLALADIIGGRVSRTRRKQTFILWPYVIQGIVFCLWFTLGDGAVPNDRYMLIIYVTYALWPLWALSGDARSPEVDAELQNQSEEK